MQLVAVLLIAAGCRDDLPTLARVAPPIVQLKAQAGHHRAPRFLRTRVPHNTKAQSTWNITRLACSGDVELNPGPADGQPPPAAGAGSGRRGSRTDGVLVLAQNIRSIRNKLGVLRACSPELRKYDIIAWTESWLDDMVETGELQSALPGHTWHRRNRPTHAGGVECTVSAGLGRSVARIWSVVTRKHWSSNCKLSLFLWCVCHIVHREIMMF